MYRPPPVPSECVVPNLAYRKRYSRPRECDNNLSNSSESSNERGVSLEALDPFRGKMKFEKNRRRDDRGYYEPRRDLLEALIGHVIVIANGRRREIINHTSLPLLMSTMLIVLRLIKRGVLYVMVVITILAPAHRENRKT
jgi:hypothetical protein